MAAGVQHKCMAAGRRWGCGCRATIKCQHMSSASAALPCKRFMHTGGGAACHERALAGAAHDHMQVCAPGKAPSGAPLLSPRHRSRGVSRAGSVRWVQARSTTSPCLGCAKFRGSSPIAPCTLPCEEQLLSTLCQPQDNHRSWQPSTTSCRTQLRHAMHLRSERSTR